MKRLAVALAVIVLLGWPDYHIFASGWEDVSRGNTRLRSILIHPQDPRIIYLGSERGILKSQDSGSNYRSILSVWGQNKRTNFIAFEPKSKNSLYAATASGLYNSCDSGKHWERIFQGRDYTERECSAVAIFSGVIYLGTKAGLFTSQDNGRSWQREAGNIGKFPILSIVYGPLYVYVAGTDGVFRSNGKEWERVFVAEATDKENGIEEDADDYDEGERTSIIKYLAIDPNNSSHLCLATSRGIYETLNSGGDWNALPDYGLLSENVNFLLLSAKSKLYATSSSGVFEYNGYRWEELSSGLAAGTVSFLSSDNQGNLYAACDKGFFKAKGGNAGNYQRDNIPDTYCKGEPEIADVQRVAIKYAEVEPQKIKRWRKQAAKRAWLPQLNTSVGRNVTDLWHWESGSSTKAGDDVLIKGDDAIEWDVSLSWDLGGLIWNDDQTSIDTRSRLMVQLRDDILDEVNKTYFQRLRVKMELDNLAIEDRGKRYEKELRLRELTASLDGLTGGYFSQQIKAKKQG